MFVYRSKATCEYITTTFIPTLIQNIQSRLVFDFIKMSLCFHKHILTYCLAVQGCLLPTNRHNVSKRAETAQSVVRHPAA